mmetsp:Transcript_28670/g.77632  ORF Transcript_28670/g.77632 Transcript_28670/m.77632 type:complete len:101 (-) Transcript_28670:264-566(-)
MHSIDPLGEKGRTRLGTGHTSIYGWNHELHETIATTCTVPYRTVRSNDRTIRSIVKAIVGLTHSGTTSANTARAQSPSTSIQQKPISLLQRTLSVVISSR